MTLEELLADNESLRRERDQWKYTAEIRQQHLEYTIKAQAGKPVGYHFSYTTPFGHVVWDIDYTPRPDAIECYPLVRAHPTTERPYNPLNDYAVIPMNPTEPVKAQVGEHEEFECPRCSATMVVHPHQTPAKTLIDPEPAYAALLSAKVALCAVNSGASIKAIAEIDSILNAAPAKD